MRKHLFTIISFVFAIIFWVIETTMHYIVFNEAEIHFIPNDGNELWMRMAIVLMIINFGIGADFFSKKLAMKEKEIEAMHIYKSMIHATQHILHNLLHQLHFFKMEASNSKDFNQDILKYYDSSINEATDLINRLSSVEKITGKDILASVDPNSINTQSHKDNSVDN